MTLDKEDSGPPGAGLFCTVVQSSEMFYRTLLTSDLFDAAERVVQ